MAFFVYSRPCSFFVVVMYIRTRYVYASYSCIYVTTQHAHNRFWSSWDLSSLREIHCPLTSPVPILRSVLTWASYDRIGSCLSYCFMHTHTPTMVYTVLNYVFLCCLPPGISTMFIPHSLFFNVIFRLNKQY